MGHLLRPCFARVLPIVDLLRHQTLELKVKVAIYQPSAGCRAAAHLRAIFVLLIHQEVGISSVYQPTTLRKGGCLLTRMILYHMLYLVGHWRCDEASNGLPTLAVLNPCSEQSYRVESLTEAKVFVRMVNRMLKF